MNKNAEAGVLLLASCALAVVLEALGLPAGLLLGPMIGAVVFALSGRDLAVPSVRSAGAQAMIGLLIAPSLNPSILATAAHEPWLFAGATLATLAASILIGLLLARWKVLPGSVAIWGSMPEAATAMVLMARAEGADWQLVAVMSYLRVILVAVLASILSAVVSGHGGGHPPGGQSFPKLDLVGLAETAAIGLAGVWGGKRLHLPAAALLGPMILGAGLEGAGLAHPQLPGWLLAPAYLLVGWRIGLGFTPDIIVSARKVALRLLLAIGGLVLFCAGCSLILARLSGKDLMTAYLATSPGGADSVAIIASATHVDVPFVMSMQVLRFIAVIIIGPGLARLIARRIRGGEDKSSANRVEQSPAENVEAP
jgi:membrane AbrB-like protein